MRRNLSIFLLFAFLTVLYGGIAHAQKFNAQTLRKMSTFISNFTETGNFNFNVQQIILENDSTFFIDFGVEHNIINYTKSRTKYKKNSGTLDTKWVKDTIEKYFAHDFSNYHSTAAYKLDGSVYQFQRPAKKSRLYAVVREAKYLSKNIIEMNGFLYNPGTKKRTGQTFVALAKPHTFNKVKTWALVSLFTKRDGGK